MPEIIIPLRSLVTVGDRDLDHVFCSAVDEDSDEAICRANVVGHLWPSDVETLIRIKVVKDRRKQPFPQIHGKFVCKRHYEMYERAAREFLPKDDNVQMSNL